MKRLFVLFGLTLLSGYASATVTTVVVPANPLWTDTGLSLTAGEKVSISASGSWTWAGWAGGYFGPNGDPNGGYQYDSWVSTANKASLVGFIGTNPYSASSGWFGVGASTTFTASPGKLWLGFNDDKVTVGGEFDNSGSVTALVQAVPEPEEWVMMLLGAGLVGFQVKRKKLQQI